MTVLLLFACAKLTVNDVTTGETPAYPDLVPIYARIHAGLAFDRAELVAQGMEGWEGCVVDPSEADPVLHCQAQTRFFTDDVWIWAEPAGVGMARVMTRSASRVGVWDLGTNAGRIEAFQEAYVAFGGVQGR